MRKVGEKIEERRAVQPFILGQMRAHGVYGLKGSSIRRFNSIKGDSLGAFGLCKSKVWTRVAPLR